MNKKDIDILLSKFYRGETTLDEERRLRESLAGDDADALLMQGLVQMDDEVEVPSDLESELSDIIDLWDDEEQQEKKVAPSMWRRSTWWVAAASVAVLAVAGYWFLRNYSSSGNKQQVIAKVEKTIPHDNTVVEEPKPPVEETTMQPQQAQQTAVSEPHNVNRPDRVSRPQEVARQASHLAQNSSEEILSPDDEQAAIAALERFSTTLNKGMNELNNADEKIENINNTIKQHL